MSTADAIKFGLWAAKLGYLPTHTEILDVFHVDRATAYRMRAALAEAWGVDRSKTAACPLRLVA